jgi:serine phosphatase RsbU (regulator of sigma subunit)
MPHRMNPINLFRKSINIQFLTLSAVSIAFTGALVGFLSYQYAKDEFESKLKNKDIPALLSLKATKIESELDKALEVSEIFSSDPELIEWFKSNGSNSKLENSAKTKMNTIAKRLNYTRVFASNYSTKEYFFYGEKKQNRLGKFENNPAILKEGEEGDKWFFDFWKSEKDSEVNIGKLSEQDKLDKENTNAYINTIIKDGQNRIGVAGVGVRLTDFVKTFFADDEDGGRTWLVDKKSMTIKISMDFSEIDKEASDIISKDIKKHIQNYEQNKAESIKKIFNKKGELTFFGYRKLPMHESLIVVYAVPYEKVMEPLSIIRKVTIGSTIFIVMIAFYVFLVYSRKITRPIIGLTDIAERISDGELNLRYTTTTRNEIGRLAASFNAMTESLGEKNRSLEDYSKNLQEKVYEQTYELARQKRELEIKNKSMQKELEMGQKVQGIFLLPFNSRSDWYEVYATSFPSKELGGDFFRIYESSRDELWLFIGDVSGKGVGSSLIMTAAVSLLDQMQGIGGSLNELARDFNSQLFHLIGSNKGSAPGFFITAGCAFLKKEGNLYYAYTVNAGHEPPLLLRENNFTALPSGGRAFGISGDTHYKLFKTELKKGDILFYVTDGIFEQRNELGDFFEFSNIQESIQKYQSESMENICHRLLEELDKFASNVSQEDDRTVIALRIL